MIWMELQGFFIAAVMMVVGMVIVGTVVMVVGMGIVVGLEVGRR